MHGSSSSGVLRRLPPSRPPSRPPADPPPDVRSPPRAFLPHTHSIRLPVAPRAHCTRGTGRGRPARRVRHRASPSPIFCPASCVCLRDRPTAHACECSRLRARTSRAGLPPACPLRRARSSRSVWAELIRDSRRSDHRLRGSSTLPPLLETRAGLCSDAFLPPFVPMLTTSALASHLDLVHVDAS
jgi:hypothetical protein